MSNCYDKEKRKEYNKRYNLKHIVAKRQHQREYNERKDVTERKIGN